MKQRIRNQLKPGCNFRIEVGKIIDGKEVPDEIILTHNLIVDNGLSQISLEGMQNFDTIKYGSGATAPAHDDTDLETEVYSETLIIEPSTDSGENRADVTYYHYLGTEAGTLGPIKEAGIFVGETMIARVTFSQINKELNSYIKVVWCFTLTGVEF